MEHEQKTRVRLRQGMETKVRSEVSGRQRRRSLQNVVRCAFGASSSVSSQHLGFRVNKRGKESITKFQLILLAGLLGGGAFLSFKSPSQPMERQFSSEDQKLMSSEFSTSSMPSLWRNPELTLYEKLFCRGNRVAEGCPEREMHPFKAYYDYYGKTLSFRGGANDRIGDEQFEFERKGLLPKIEIERSWSSNFSD